jgi:hypothetical protein
MSSDNFVCPRDSVAHPDAGRLWPGPEFQIFLPVVIAYAVAVMDRLRWQHVTADDLLHNDNVFEYVLPFPYSRVVGGPEHDIPGFMASASALPSTV